VDCRSSSCVIESFLSIMKGRMEPKDPEASITKATKFVAHLHLKGQSSTKI
jgi:hypothetical protein